MTRTPLAFIVAVAVATAGCSQSPVSPSAAGQGSLSSLAAKPGSQPAGSDHALTFGGQISGLGTVSGWITGSAVDGNLLAHATSGSLALTIAGTSNSGPAQDAECSDGESILYTSGLIGGQISGSFSVDVDQDGSKSNTDPTMDWSLSGVEVSDGRTWRVQGISTFNYPPQVTGDSTGMGVTVNDIKVLFSRLATSGRKNSTDLSIGCRVNLEMTMAPQ
jgi:hypothetical protein